jgi:hypothetical protein
MNTTASQLLAALAVALCSGASAQVLSDSLIAHFPMDGSPNDTVVGLVPVVTSGIPGFCADRFGNANSAACFDGSSFWSYGDVLDMDTSDFSLAMWLNIDSIRLPFEIQPGFVSEGAFIAGKGTSIFSSPTRAGYSVIGTNNGIQSITLNGITGNESNDVRLASIESAIDTWFHFTFSRCGQHQLIYMNGVLLADSIVPTPRDLSVNTVFSIGAMNRDPSSQPDSEWLLGSIDDLRVYKGRCLAESEILTLTDPGVVMYELVRPGPNMQLFPNPASSSLRIVVLAPINVTGPVFAFNGFGQQVPLHAGRITMVQGAVRTLTMDVEHLAKGAYFVVVPTEKGQMRGWFVKE